MSITITVESTVTEITGVLDRVFEQLERGDYFGIIFWSNHGYYPLFAIKPNGSRCFINMWYNNYIYSLKSVNGSNTYYRFDGSVIS